MSKGISSETERKDVPAGEGPYRSAAVHEIISARSGFVSRWALMIFLFVLLILLACTWFIQYPETVEEEAIIIAGAPAHDYYAQLNLREEHGDKLRTGQRVELRLNAYSYQQFGFIEGRLAFISGIPSVNGIMVRIELPNGLSTNYKKQIPYRDGLKAQAIIVLGKTRLWHKLYHTIGRNISR
jgi:hypothetical protein